MGNPHGPEKATRRKPYEKPSITKLTAEEVKTKLIDHARRGDRRAKEILQTVFPEARKNISTSKKKSA